MTDSKKNWFTSLFTDKEWDFDLPKVIGFVCIVAGVVGFFLGKDGFQWIIGFGAGLLGISKSVEGV